MPVRQHDYDWEFYKVVGYNLKKLRNSLGMSQQAFADHILFNSKQSYGLVERGLVRLNLEDYHRIVRTFGIPFRYLFEGYEFRERREWKRLREERRKVFGIRRGKNVNKSSNPS